MPEQPCIILERILINFIPGPLTVVALRNLVDNENAAQHMAVGLPETTHAFEISTRLMLAILQSFAIPPISRPLLHYYDSAIVALYAI